MKTYIIINSAELEQIEPTLPLVKELIRRGNIVVYYTAEMYRSMIERSGAEFRNYPINIVDYQEKYTERRLTNEFKKQSKKLESWLIEDVKNEEPFVILYNVIFSFVKNVGQKLNIPTVSLVMQLVEQEEHKKRFNLNESTFALKIEKLKYKLMGQKNKELRNNDVYSDLNFVYTFMDFQPYATLLSDRFQFVGYPLQDHEQNSLDQINDDFVLYMTFSNEFLSIPKVIKAINNFVGDRRCLVIFQNHLKLDSTQLPPNFLVVTQELSSIDFRKVNCLITDGGMKRVHLGLKHKKPMMLIPQTDEQVKLAKRIEACMTGVVLNTVNEEEIQDQLERVLMDERFVANATLMGNRFEVPGGVGKIIHEIEQFIQ